MILNRMQNVKNIFFLLNFKISFYLLRLADSGVSVLNFLFHFIFQHFLLLPIKFLQQLGLLKLDRTGLTDYFLCVECCFNNEQTFYNKFRHSGLSISRRTYTDDRLHQSLYLGRLDQLQSPKRSVQMFSALVTTRVLLQSLSAVVHLEKRV